MLYHLTDLDNLPGILKLGIVSRAELRAQGLAFKDVADPGILEKRALSELDQWVPFHFMTRNPFDYGVVRSWPNRRFAILSVYRSQAAALGWKIIPLHPLTSEGEPVVLEWAAGIEAIDWSEMDKQDRDFNNDHHCKMTCMAEALSPTPVTIKQCAFVYVADEESKTRAEQVLMGRVPVQVTPNKFPRRGR